MLGDTLSDGVPGRSEPDEDRGQVGIGTLIVFIAMVLVAAIAAGVLINTAGFLQSKAQQTGEESSAQVTNQLQILSRTGIISDSSAEADTRAVVLYPVNNVAGDGGDERNPLVFDNGDTVSVTVDNGDTDTELSGTSTSGVVAVADGETLEFTRDGDSITISNVDTGSSVTIGADESITVGDGDGNNGDVTFTFSTTENSDLVLGPVTEQTNTGGSADLAAELFTRTESFLTVKDDAATTQSLLLNDSSTASVVSATDGGDGEVVLTGGGGDSGTLTVQAADTLSVGVSSNQESEVTLTNQRTSASITFDPTNGLETGEGGETVTLSDQVAATGDVEIEDGGESANIFTRAITDGTSITQIELVIGRGAGSGDIDMSGTVISMRAPDGSFTLTYAPGGATEDTTFGLQGVRDEDNTLPVLSSGDRFKLVIDPGKIAAGETIELTITTGSGAKRVLQLRVPDSLANENAVGL